MKKNKKVLISMFSNENPYQLLLKKEFLKNDYEVFTIEEYSFLEITTTSFRENISTIRIDWAHQFYLTKKYESVLFNLFVTFLKSLHFILDILASKLLVNKIIWRVHNLMNHERKFKKIEIHVRRTLVRLANIVEIECKKAEDKLRQFLNISEPIKKIKKVGFGSYIDYYPNSKTKREARERLNLNREDFVFLHFGKIKPYKNTKEIIKNFLKLDIDKVKLIIAGSIDENYEKELKPLYENNKRILVFDDFIPKKKVQLFFNSADIMVNNYRDILSSGSVILGMSFGLPIIAPEKGCISKHIQKKLLFRENLENKMIEAITELNLKKIGEENKKRAKSMSWKRIVKNSR